MELINKFRQIEYFKGFSIALKIKDVTNTPEIIIISDKFVELNELIEVRKTVFKDIKHVFYMVSNENYKSNMKSVLESNRIIMIPPKKTIKQIIEIVCSYTLDGVKSKNNIVVFYGADAKVGTTQIAQSVAERVSDKTNLKVFLGFLNGEPTTNYIETENSYNLDTIKVKLVNQILSINEILDICTKKNNLYILQGTESILERRHYHPVHIEYLLELVSNEFDLIIIDAGSNIELGMTIASLNSTPYKYLVTTQQESILVNYNRVYEQVLSRLDIKDFLVIVNKYIDEPMLHTSYQVAQLYKGTLASTLPHLNWGWQSEKDKKTLLHYEEPQYTEGIDQIIKLISNQVKFKYEKENKENKSLFVKIKSKFVG
jgi:septum formation inhibitor-activating ATPase MinD